MEQIKNFEKKSKKKKNPKILKEEYEFFDSKISFSLSPSVSARLYIKLQTEKIRNRSKNKSEYLILSLFLPKNFFIFFIKIE